MDQQELEERHRLALSVTRDAGALAAGFYHRRATLSVERKGLQDLVSQADRATEELIVANLSLNFPDDPFLGEEGGLRKRGSMLWVIDPIDGTANFLRGIPHWCVSLGLVVENETVIGFLFDPLADEMFSAHGPAELGPAAQLLDAGGANDGMTVIVLSCALPLNVTISMLGATQVVTLWIGAIELDQITLLLVLIVFYVILGMFMDAMSMLVLTVPIAAPMVVAAGVDPGLVRHLHHSHVRDRPDHATERSLAAAQQCRDRHGAQGIVLGSGALAGRRLQLRVAFGMPVVDGLEAAITHCECAS